MQLLESELERKRRYQEFLEQNTLERTMDSHLTRETSDLTGTHHELDGFVHTDPHDAFSSMEDAEIDTLVFT
jgi:hypothetical protein